MNSERIFLEEKAIIDVFMQYLKEIKSEDSLYHNAFDREIAFTLQKEINHYDDENKETISLYPMTIQKQKLEIPIKKKYTLKERLRILFKGE